LLRKASGPKILTLDIETAPIESYHWGLWQENIGLNQIVSDWTILSFSAKWLGNSKTIYQDTGGRGKSKVRDDKKLLEELWKLLDEADIVVTQNGISFDIKKINARMLQAGLRPYSPIKVVDTKVIAKKHFAFTSNRLEYLGTLAGSPKSHHKKFPGFELWAECLKDNPLAWAEMRKYNIADVVATERLYLKLRPWMEGHPNLAAYQDMDSSACPKCSSKNLQKRGTARTQTGEYHRFQCNDCGGWARGRQTLRKRPQLLVN
jgi:DNA polymerase III epsilon subunit-like protein